MDQNQLEAFRALLLQIRREIVHEMKDLKNGEKEESIKESSGNLSGYSIHLADAGSDNIEQEQQFISIERDGKTLHDLDDALYRIDQGTFGECEICQGPIGLGRLEVIPYARLCIKCQSRDEMMKARFRENPFEFENEYSDWN